MAALKIVGTQDQRQVGQAGGVGRADARIQRVAHVVADAGLGDPRRSVLAGVDAVGKGVANATGGQFDSVGDVVELL